MKKPLRILLSILGFLLSFPVATYLLLHYPIFLPGSIAQSLFFWSALAALSWFFAHLSRISIHI